MSIIFALTPSSLISNNQMSSPVNKKLKIASPVPAKDSDDEFQITYKILMELPVSPEINYFPLPETPAYKEVPLPDSDPSTSPTTEVLPATPVLPHTPITK